MTRSHTTTAAFVVAGLTATASHAQCPPRIVQNPIAWSGCIGQSISFQVAAVGDGTLQYQWLKHGRAGTEQLQDAGRVRGARTARLEIAPAALIDAAEYSCVVTIGCGTVQSPRAAFSAGCIANLNDGSGPECEQSIDTLLYYLFLYESGNEIADVDDGSGTGTPDAGVTIDDLLYFLRRFDMGC